MRFTAPTRVAALAAILAFGVTAAASAQPAVSEPGDAAGQDQSAPCAQAPMTPPGMMGRGMMGRGMMGRGMMGATPMMGGRGHMMKIMFAIADADGDRALSFEEVTAVHKRVFDAVDANKDGKVTPDEAQTFMRP
jgi:hypothetical protein